jgi:hypothetical protein
MKFLLDPYRVWLKSLPRWPYLLGGAAIGLFSLVVQWLGGAGSIRDFFFSLHRDLSLIQPFNLIPMYLEAFRECDYLAQIDDYNCSNARFFDPRRLIGALVTTIGRIWQMNDRMSALVQIMVLAFAFYLSVGVIKRLFQQDESNIFTVIAAAAAAPFVMSISALALQWATMGLAYLLGTLVGIIIYLTVLFAIPIRIFTALRNAESAARQIERGQGITGAMQSSQNIDDKPR